MEKLPKITKAKQVGQNFTVVIGDDTITLKGDKETLTPAKEAAKKYSEKPTKTNYNSLIKLMQPKATAAKEEKVKAVAAVKGKIKEVKAAAAPKGKAKVKAAKVNLVKELQSQMVDGELTESDAEAMRRLLAKSDAKKQQASAHTPKPTRREY